MPSDDVPLPVAKREPARVEPVVHAVETTQSYFVFKGRSRGERSLKRQKVPRLIVRVKGAVCRPLTQLLLRPSDIVHTRLIDPFDLAPRAQSCNQAGNAVQHQGRFVRAFAQRFLGALLIIDIGDQCVPASNVSVSIAMRRTSVLEPAIDTVCSPEARHEVIRLASGERAGKGIDDGRQILRMNRVAGSPRTEFLQSP